MYRTFSSVCCPYLFESVYTASTGSVFLATGKLSNSTYINELIQFLSLWSFGDCGFRVSSRIRVSVGLFYFLHFFLSSVG